MLTKLTATHGDFYSVHTVVSQILLLRTWLGLGVGLGGSLGLGVSLGGHDGKEKSE